MEKTNLEQIERCVRRLGVVGVLAPEIGLVIATRSSTIDLWVQQAGSNVNTPVSF